MRFLAIVIAAISLQSCNVAEQRKADGGGATQMTMPGRFTSAGSHDIALDTQTGQLCRTWDWSPSRDQPKSNPALEIKPGQYAPLCITLYNSYPSNMPKDDPLGIRPPVKQ